MNAIATRPVAESMPIAGRTSSPPACHGGRRATRSRRPSTSRRRLRSCVRSATAQSCQVAQTRPLASTSADGSGKARKPWIPHVRCRLRRCALAAPRSLRRPSSVRRRLRSGQPREIDHDEIAVGPDRREDAHRRPGADVRAAVDQVSPPSSDHLTASMSAVGRVRVDEVAAAVEGRRRGVVARDPVLVEGDALLASRAALFGRVERGAPARSRRRSG